MRKSFAAALLAAETLLLATLWGPQPAGWLWIGSQIFHNTGSVGIGILVAFVGMLLTILGTIGLAMPRAAREFRARASEPVFLSRSRSSEPAPEPGAATATW